MSDLWELRPRATLSFDPEMEEVDTKVVRSATKRRPPSVSAETECHVTPDDVAQRMVDHLAPAAGDLVLEPECGTGQLVKALLSHGCDVVGIERHYDLFDYCRDVYPEARIYRGDFLDPMCDGTVGKLYDYILMNPPFRKVKQHIQRALSVLSPDGEIVALVPNSFDRDEEISTTLFELGPDTFTTTKVYTKVISITH